MINLNDKFITDVMPEIGAKATVVLLAICKHIDANNIAFPSKLTIQKYTSLGKDSVDEALKTLVHFSQITKRQRVKKGKFTSNEYTVITKFIKVYVTGKTPILPCTDLPCTVLPSTDSPCTVKPPISINKIGSINKKGSIVVFPKTTEDSFNRIYKAKSNQGREFTVAEVIDYLNEITGKRFKSTTKATKTLISARIKEGYSFGDFKKVIDVKWQEWQDDPKQKKYVQPSTLFAPSHFDNYLNQDFVKPISNLIQDIKLSPEDEEGFNSFVRGVISYYPELKEVKFTKSGYKNYVDRYKPEMKKRMVSLKNKAKWFNEFWLQMVQDKYFSKTKGDFFEESFDRFDKKYKKLGYHEAS